jgi:chromosome segregation ATPase
VIWALLFLAALTIPLAAVVLDSPALTRWLERRHGIREGGGTADADIKRLEAKLEALESELDVANREITQLKESQQFFQRLLEDPAARQAAARLPKPQP